MNKSKILNDPINYKNLQQISNSTQRQPTKLNQTTNLNKPTTKEQTTTDQNKLTNLNKTANLNKLKISTQLTKLNTPTNRNMYNQQMYNRQCTQMGSAVPNRLNKTNNS